MNTTGSLFGKEVVAHTPEIERIRLLRRRVWTEEEGRDLASDMTRLLKTPQGTMYLRPLQAISLYELAQVGGLLGPQRVGSGKTITTILAALVLEAKRPVLLLPASLVSKTKMDLMNLSQHWRLPTNLQLMSYESLSLVQNARKLEYIQPDLLICDEVHYLASSRSGRSRRVARYMKEYPNTQFVGVSGTIMKKSIVEFGKILRWALKDNAPVPAGDVELVTWSEALDENVNPLQRRRPGALQALAYPPRAVMTLPAARQVFQERLLETRGVVASARTDGVTCSLVIRALDYRPAAVTEWHVRVLRSRWETPCGKPFSEAVEFRQHMRELALGFHYTWVDREKIEEWNALIKKSNEKTGARNVANTKNGEGSIRNVLQQKSTTCEKPDTVSLGQSTKRFSRDLATNASFRAAADRPERKDFTSITTTQQEKCAGSFVPSIIEELACSEIMLELSAPLLIFLQQNRAPPDWLNARRTWCSFVRETIGRSQKYDTAKQVAIACDAGKLDSSALVAWRAIEDRYKPLTRAVFHDTSALEACVTWMQENNGIVWVEHRAFGEALSRLTGASYYEGGGLDGAGNSIKDAKPGKAIIASVAACGQGFNLQCFSKNLITSCPPGAATLEQLIGRTHRDGQEEDEVTVDILLGCSEHFQAFERALEGARAAADTLGHDQKLLLCTLVWPTSITNRKGGLDANGESLTPLWD